MDIYGEITSRILTQMEQGIIPWHKPWTGSDVAISHATGRPYSLLNQMLLGAAGEYLTFNECAKEGGRVKKGAKSQFVVFWKFIERENEETHEVESVPFLRYYNVFHISQCEGVSPKYDTEKPSTSATPVYEAETIASNYLAKYGIKLSSEGNEAYYSPAYDRVNVPSIDLFGETSEYYSTLFHELTHSTGHASRLARLSDTAFFGSESYSKEELIAEIGASALVNHCGLETKASFDNNTAYIQNWLTVLRNDKHFIVSASGKAEKAVNLILGA